MPAHHDVRCLQSRLALLTTDEKRVGTGGFMIRSDMSQIRIGLSVGN